MAEQLIEEVAEQVALLRERKEEEKQEEKEIDSTPPPPSPLPTSQHGRLPALDSCDVGEMHAVVEIAGCCYILL